MAERLQYYLAQIHLWVSEHLLTWSEWHAREAGRIADEELRRIG